MAILEPVVFKEVRSVEMQHATHLVQDKSSGKTVSVPITINAKVSGLAQQPFSLRGAGEVDICMECGLVLGGRCLHRYENGGSAIITNRSAGTRGCTVCGAALPPPKTSEILNGSER